MHSREYLPALADLGRALHRKPSSIYAWKSMAFVLAAAARGQKLNGADQNV
jgi:hypothetical protein